MELGTVFTDYSVKKLQQLADRIDDCLQRLEDSEIWWRKAGAQNAAGNLVLHLCGNLGQWIGTGVGGNPDKRRRDEEFRADGGVSREELRERLRDRVTESCRIIAGLKEEQLGEMIRVQNYDVTKLEAVYHAIEHFAQHTGQIIFLTKLLKEVDLGYYTHLSAPKAPDPTP